MAPKKPLVADIFCGLGGWTEGFLAEGYDAVGFDIERHHYGNAKYLGDLVLQDARTIHGKQLKDATVIVASSPCQAYSYMAMPWKRAKQIARAFRGEDVFPEGYTGYRTISELNELFEQPKRIQREAIEAAGHFIPMIQENVRGAIPWVGRSQWNFGSYHLWGDVPALMPIPYKAHKVNPDGTNHGTGSWFAVADSKNRGASEGTKAPGVGSWYPPDDPRHQPGLDFTRLAGERAEGKKNPGFRFDGSGKSFQSESVNRTIKGATLCEHEGVKQRGDWFGDGRQGIGMSAVGGKSKARKAASAAIAKIPISLSQHIARVYKREVPHAR